MCCHRRVAALVTPRHKAGRGKLRRLQRNSGNMIVLLQAMFAAQMAVDDDDDVDTKDY
jgi:hypothetical protein